MIYNSYTSLSIDIHTDISIELGACHTKLLQFLQHGPTHLWILILHTTARKHSFQSPKFLAFIHSLTSLQTF